MVGRNLVKDYPSMSNFLWTNKCHWLYFVVHCPKNGWMILVCVLCSVCYRLFFGWKTLFWMWLDFIHDNVIYGKNEVDEIIGIVAINKKYMNLQVPFVYFLLKDFFLWESYQKILKGLICLQSIQTPMFWNIFLITIIHFQN
jgi:hypothetical protein